MILIVRSFELFWSYEIDPVSLPVTLSKNILEIEGSDMDFKYVHDSDIVFQCVLIANSLNIICKDYRRHWRFMSSIQVLLSISTTVSWDQMYLLKDEEPTRKMSGCFSELMGIAIRVSCITLLVKAWNFRNFSKSWMV